MNVYIVSASITAMLYAAVKFFQMRFVEKEARPVKELVGDSCVVLLATFCRLDACRPAGVERGVGAGAWHAGRCARWEDEGLY